MAWFGLDKAVGNATAAAVSGVVDTISATVDKFIETPDEKRDYAKFQDELQAHLQDAQAAINLADAKSGNWFQAGWRPFIGWVCGFGLAWQWVFMPFTVFFVQIGATWLGLKPFDLTILPKLNGEEIMGLLSALLGLGTLRTYEKTR